MAVLPANVGSGYVTGRLIQAVLDGSDPDDKPDGIPIARALEEHKRLWDELSTKKDK